jgi:hypothetical protein
MPSDSPHVVEDVPERDVTTLLVRANELAEKVENLPDGLMK